MSKIAFFDIDGTMITESIWDYFLRQPEIAPQKRGVYARFLPTFAARKIGILKEANFREAWVREMARLMKGWSRQRVDELFDRIVFHEFGDRFRADVAARVREHTTSGDRVVLVSGMFDGFAQRFSKLIGAEAGLGTVLGYAHDTCTGAIEGRGCAGDAKPDFMRRYLADHDLTSTHGYADSYSDVPMLTAVGTPIATYPDDQLRAHALAHGWAIFPR